MAIRCVLVIYDKRSDNPLKSARCGENILTGLCNVCSLCIVFAMALQPACAPSLYRQSSVTIPLGLNNLCVFPLHTGNPL